MIDCRNDITMAAQMSTKKCGGPPVPATVMGVNDQRIRFGMCGGIPHSHLTARFVAHRNGVDVLSFPCNVLTRMPRRPGIPDFARKYTVSCHVTSRERPN